MPSMREADDVGLAVAARSRGQDRAIAGEAQQTLRTAGALRGRADDDTSSRIDPPEAARTHEKPQECSAIPAWIAAQRSAGPARPGSMRMSDR
jgi:hypothetical protein